MEERLGFLYPLPATVFGIIISLQLTGLPIPFPSYTIPSITIISTLLCFRKFEGFNKNMFFLMVYLPLNILLANPDPRFRSWGRLLIFFTVLFAASPLLQGEYARAFRKQMLKTFLFTGLILSVISFIFYFLRINLMKLEGEYITDYENATGGFAGIFKQSMLLGPISGLATLAILYYGFVTQKKKLFWLLIPCVGSLLFSASRSAFVATIIASLLIIWKLVEKKRLFFEILIGTLLALIVSYPLWVPSTSGLRIKQERNEQIEGRFGSRSIKWEERIYEFSAKPVIGWGFSSQNPDSRDDWNKETGTIEPGSSWLAILSMTGLVGFLLFTVILLKSFHLAEKSSSKDKPLFIAILVLFCIHMVAEGYVFAGGSQLCLVLWLTIGCNYDLGYPTTPEEEAEEITHSV